MASISWLTAEIAKYKNIVSNVSNLILLTDNAKNTMQPALSLNNYFSIDGSAPDNGGIEDSIKNMNSIIDTLNALKGNLQGKISKLEEELRKELERIELEKQNMQNPY